MSRDTDNEKKKATRTGGHYYPSQVTVMVSTSTGGPTPFIFVFHLSRCGKVDLESMRRMFTLKLEG